MPKISNIFTLTHSSINRRDLFLLKSASRGRFQTENKSFEKKPPFAWICLYLKEAKLSTFESAWWLSIWEHNEIFCYYFLIFWQNISLCSQISAVSTIQLWLNLASLKYKQMWAFYQKICFSARKCPLEAMLTRNRSRLLIEPWFWVREKIMTPISMI